MKKLTPEIVEKAKTAASVDELLAIAKENDVELTEDEAKIYFAQLNANGAVADEELDLVAGGCGDDEVVTFEQGELVELRIACPDCKCIVGIYGHADNVGGCHVLCAKCHNRIWVKDKRDVKKMYAGPAI